MCSRPVGIFHRAWGHINLQEGYAVQQTLEMYCEDHSDRIAGSTLISDVDSKVLHDSLKRGKLGRKIQSCTHRMIVDLFWLQVEHDLHAQVTMDTFQGEC